MFKQFLIITVLLRLTTSHPTAEAASLPIKRTRDERIFLANCRSWNNIPNPPVSTTWSEIDWYSTDAASRTGQYPDTSVKVSSSGHITWEGQQISGTFHDGNTFVSVIESGAQSLPNFDYAGYGWNNYHGFDCYKDDGRVLWSWEGGIGQGGAGAACMSSYWCVDSAYVKK